MANFNFNDKTRRIPQKPISSSLLSTGRSVLRTVEVDDVGTLGIPVYPYKYLPVMFKASDIGDLKSDDGIVMPKGTIVSLVTNQNTIYATASGLVPINSGSIPVFIDQIDGDTETSAIDGGAWGYPDSVIALMVPANGGVQSSIPYTAALEDATYGWNPTSGNLTVTANIPVGIVYQDVYQDIRGKFLNYQEHDVYGIASRGFLNIPYVNTEFVDFGTDANVQSADTKGYEAVWKTYQFLYGTGMVAGTVLQSDLYGKFVVTSGGTSPTMGNAIPNIQSVGKVIACDSRFPKSNLNMVQSYGSTLLPGKNTGGLPTELFLFIRTIEAYLGNAVTAAAILDKVQRGHYGIARIQLTL